jgi:hypothetical protein
LFFAIFKFNYIELKYLITIAFFCLKALYLHYFTLKIIKMTIEFKKLQLITEIALLSDEVILDYYAQLLAQANRKNGKKTPKSAAPKAKLPISLTDVSRPMRDVIDLEALKKEQNWKPTSATKMQQLAVEMDIQEPIENLIKMI